MLDNIKTEDVLFLDIETVPQYRAYGDTPELYRKLWDKKTRNLREKSEDISPEDFYQRAGIYAEFGKIICISAGMITMVKQEKTLRLKSFYGDEEKNILHDFTEMLDNLSAKKDVLLCAHNGKEFDFPYIARRILINGLKLPRLLDLAGKKPWEVPHLDTLELWKFGDYKNYTSLELLSMIFGIESPKNDIDGSQVAYVYRELNDLHRIVEYCENDTLAVARLFMKFKGENEIGTENIISVTF